jgi:hypothetical protein
VESVGINLAAGNITLKQEINIDMINASSQGTHARTHTPLVSACLRQFVMKHTTR